MADSLAIMLFRSDLRLGDNAALRVAMEQGESVLPVFLWDPEDEHPWAPGAAARWWLHHSLLALEESLAKRGSQLIIRTGESIPSIKALAEEVGATSAHWNQRPESTLAGNDAELAEALRGQGLTVTEHDGSLLHDPALVSTGGGTPFRVFTPFWRRLSELVEAQPPVPKPRRIPAPSKWPKSLPLESLELLPRVDWAEGLRETWTPGELGAHRRLRAFGRQRVRDYDASRDHPAQEGTSRLSPHLHFGEITPRQIWNALVEHAGAEPFLRQLAWREFAHHLLWHFPETADAPLRPEFEHFPWRENDKALRAWQRGRTGYPIVDAGMRELWHTGWMHNRVRMIVASFLVKDLLIDWREGARWFWDTLVDADLPNNTLGWQWVAGCGADAAPYFRVFNPVSQGERFDPEGEYVRRWVPELADLPNETIHRPWEAGDLFTPDYPEPIVDHAMARRRALIALDQMKSKAG